MLSITGVLRIYALSLWWWPSIRLLLILSLWLPFSICQLGFVAHDSSYSWLVHVVPGSWVSIDLKKNLVSPTFYSMSHRCAMNDFFVRNWYSPPYCDLMATLLIQSRAGKK